MAPFAVGSTAHLPVNVAKRKGVNGLPNIELAAKEQDDLVLRTFGCLIADLCEQFKRGHPGSIISFVFLILD